MQKKKTWFVSCFQITTNLILYVFFCFFLPPDHKQNLIFADKTLFRMCFSCLFCFQITRNIISYMLFLLFLLPDHKKPYFHTCHCFCRGRRGMWKKACTTPALTKTFLEGKGRTFSPFFLHSPYEYRYAKPKLNTSIYPDQVIGPYSFMERNFKRVIISTKSKQFTRYKVSCWVFKNIRDGSTIFFHRFSNANTLASSSKNYKLDISKVSQLFAYLNGCMFCIGHPEMYHLSRFANQTDTNGLTVIPQADAVEG